jgi:protein tyrosine kinase modulator
MRDYGTMQGAYQSLLAKKQDSQISTNLERRQIGEQFKILDPARLPTRPFSPNRPRLYLMGIVGGFAFGLTLVALLEYLDRRLRSEEDVRAALNLPVLATIPWIHETSEQRPRHVVAISVSAATMILVGAVVIAWRILR